MDQPSFNDRLAVGMTRVIGTMPMFYALIAWYGLWIGINLLLGPHAFDEPWSFPILLFISNFCQLIWLPALSVGQNVMGRASADQAKQQYAMIERMDTLSQRQQTMMETMQTMVQALLTMGEHDQADRREILTLLASVQQETQEIDDEVDTLREAIPPPSKRKGRR